MTAEIAVMNGEAVALATDSAVTSSVTPVTKTSPSANKLFSLSNNHPVGIMVYGNAMFMGIPWEAIIKEYRKDLPERGFDTVREYANDFVSSLNCKSIRFPDGFEAEYIEAFVVTFLLNLRNQIVRRSEFALREGKTASARLMSDIINEVISGWNEYIQQCDKILPLKYGKEIHTRYLSGIEDSIKDIFLRFQLTKQITNTLHNMIIKALARVFLVDVATGVVIAGFGEKEYLPSLISYDIEGIITCQNGKKTKEVLKCAEDKERSTEVTADMNGAVIAFAQSEMVQRFMDGVDPKYEYAADEFFEGLCQDLIEKIVGQLSKYTDPEKKQIKQELNDYTVEVLEEYHSRMSNFVNEEFSGPTIQAVSRLPRNELANMAEALVYLTSLKRKVSEEAETVAEPIDVAVISKGDGFIWIKRKHYFRPELNIRYLIRSLRSVK